MSNYFGVDYYPEHWPRKRWETDARLMQELGITIVRMGEFSWHKFEPEEGVFCFDWLDEAIELLASYGIETLLGTPTAAPPAWLIKKDPDILPVDSHGQTKSFGSRHHDCMSNTKYRAHIRRLVSQLAGHYKDNPHVIGWQIDNELGNSHEDLCMCESCRQHFGQWLEKKYETINHLNEAWGTVFWSQTYDSFDQIPTPRQTPVMHNPSLLLDWKRFCSDLVVDFQNFQIDIIQSIAPHHQVTHNLMGLYDKTDYFKLAQKLDFASNDQYPAGYYFDPPGQSDEEISACLDFIRSVKKKNFWMMELQSGPTGGALIGRSPRPGQLALWTSHCVAHGADTIIYFRWRTCLFGSEQFWHGILPHHGQPERRYKELKETMQCLRPIMEDIQGITAKAKAAILFSYDQDFAVQIQPHHPQLSYIEQVKKYYDGFYQRNVAVDFISEEECWQEYQLIVAPLQYLMSPGLEDKMQEYVRQGGHLVLTMRTGVKNMNNVCMDSYMLPGRLGEMLKIKVIDYDCLLGGEVDLRWLEPESKGKGLCWSDVLESEGAEILAVYDNEYYKGHAAITVNHFGKGDAWYVGTEPDKTVIGQLADQWIDRYGLSENRQSPERVEMTVRTGRNADYLFVLNHSGEEKTVDVQPEWNLYARSLPADGMEWHMKAVEKIDAADEDHTLLPAYGIQIYKKRKMRAANTGKGD